MLEQNDILYFYQKQYFWKDAPGVIFKVFLVFSTCTNFRIETNRSVIVFSRDFDSSSYKTTIFT
jgi:hypothetical protein